MKTRKIIFRGAYLIASSIFCLGTLEIFSRIVRPIFPGAQKIGLSGKRFDRVSFNTPGLNYFQYSSEYNAKTTIDERGNRITPTSNNKSLEGVIFLGDSQTFGQGISDDETIASKFCQLSNKAIKCVNLGKPGANTISQLKKLKDYAKNYNIEGYTVFNLLNASTINPFSGNDISDCFIADNTINNKNDTKGKNYVLQIGRDLSKRSNLFRLLRFSAGVKVRTIGYSISAEKVSDRDVECFVRTANDIKLFTNSMNARYLPVIVSPSSEIAMGLTEEILNKIRKVFDEDAVAPNNISVKDFYAIDGHYTNIGAEKVARFLISVYQ